jgi:hypothetical protein
MQTKKLSTIYSNIDAQNPRAPREWPRFMSARVAADYSDTSPWTIRRHIQPCGKRGRSYVYAIEDVENWMRGEAFEPRMTSASAAVARRSGVPSTTSFVKIREHERLPRREASTVLDANRNDMAA